MQNIFYNRYILPFLLFSSLAAADPFIKIEVEGVHESLLTSARTFSLPSGHRVTLLANVHIGDGDYFKSIQNILDNSSYVLYELNGYNGSQERDELKKLDTCRKQFALSTYTIFAELYLKLLNQFDVIQYRDRFIHADVADFKDPGILGGQQHVALPRTEEACKARLRNFDDKLKYMGLKGSTDEDEPAELKRKLLESPQLKNDLKDVNTERRDFARGAIATTSSSLEAMQCDERSQVAFVKLVGLLVQAKEPTDIVILYGSSHMPYLESRIQTELKGRMISERWLKVCDWSLDSSITQMTEL